MLFNKKKPFNNEEKPMEKIVEEQEVEVIEKNCPDVNVAITLVRDAIRDHIMPICNIDEQHKADIATCLDYLTNYVRKYEEIESVIKHIDDSELIQYSNVFEKNGYVIKVYIDKEGK